MPNLISEDQIEQALLRRLRDHGYDQLNCHTERPEDLNDGSNRASKREVILADRLRTAVHSLNPGIPTPALEDALARVLDRRQAMSPLAANRELYEIIRDGVPVAFDDAQGRPQHKTVKLIDFNQPANNQFLAVSQLWVKGEIRYRRPDVLLYINGLPLVFIELKNSNIKLQTAFDDNLSNYKRDIPQLFLANALCVLSNGIETRVGSITAEWEHFFTWLRAEEKDAIDRRRLREEGENLQGVIAGLLPPRRLLDYIENFVLYYGENQKIIAQNHQFIGVNRAYDKFQKREDVDGKLGVFWHTQGSGKSFSMIFYVRKILRKVAGHFTFVVVTDRDDLDGQIYRNFLHTNTVSEADAAQPKSSEQMREFLRQNKKLVFTLIQKFGWPKGGAYPLLSDRSDIVVIVDEAHRTQYRTLAENMRVGLPNAQYLAFTGTPLLGRDRLTNQWFGDYVSEYNFQQSIDDGATMPLFYQKRVPQVLLQNDDLNEEFAEIVEDENLDDAQRDKLANRFSQEIEVIKRDDRLDTIAADIVFHFPRRGYLGKGMVVSVDKFTAVRMHDKIKRLWDAAIRDLRGEIKRESNLTVKAQLERRLEYMRSVEMAVVVSEEADEDKKFNALGLTIKPHRQRMNALDANGHDIEFNFKDPSDKLQLVFVCAMWLTGFDVPTLSTLYLDKPMKDHTLMQTIARANRVTPHKIAGVDKTNGEIIDYYNVFRNMRKALQDYAHGQGDETEQPVEEKNALFKLLDGALAEGNAFCLSHGIDLKALATQKDVFASIEGFKAHANTLLGRDEWRRAFSVYENTITGLYQASKPEILGRLAVREVAAFQYLRGVIDSIVEQADLDAVALRVSALLDESLVVDHATTARESRPGFGIAPAGRIMSLSQIDIEQQRASFRDSPYQNIQIADLRAFIQKKLDEMVRENVTRADFARRLQDIIDRYNAGCALAEHYHDELLEFAQGLKAEEERHIREGLTPEELELFDLLKQDKLTKDEQQQVKLAARSLLRRLREEKPNVLVQDWFKDSQSKERVREAIGNVLDSHLPSLYDSAAFRQKRDTVLDQMVSYASQGLKWT
jgi:type I restriction enzyme R subunit